MRSPRLTLGRLPRLTAALLLCWLLLAALPPQRPVMAAPPQLILPTVPGEAWKIIQGYACGTHNAWDRYSLDLVQVDGPTYDAPIRAAASGEIWHWESRSGTLILNHGGNFFTMYTHMGRAVSTERGRFLHAGETLGYAGDRGSPGVPHLHFTAFTASSNGWSNKQSVPLSFAEGYSLPEVGGCNQHGGTVVTAKPLQAPEISFGDQAQPGTWYNTDRRIEFRATWGGGGISQAWGAEPAGDAPMFPGAYDGYASLSDRGEGLHTLYVRAWGTNGQQSLASFGPVGYDVTPPGAPPTIGEVRLSAGAAAVVQWPPASDNAAGVAGYRIYIGPAADGTSEWFSDKPFVKTEPLSAGAYFVRVQSRDNAGNYGAWATIGTLVVAEPAADE